MPSPDITDMPIASGDAAADMTDMLIASGDPAADMTEMPIASGDAAADMTDMLIASGDPAADMTEMPIASGDVAADITDMPIASGGPSAGITDMPIASRDDPAADSNESPQLSSCAATDVCGSSRLGNCQRCQDQPAKYTCPGCSDRTCSLTCSVAHKLATGCSGRRDPTKFVSLSQFTDADLMSDYRFLESVDHSVDRVVRLRQSLGAPACALSRQQRDMQAFCRIDRGVQLFYMPHGMDRRRANHSHLRRQRQGGVATQALHWTVEARFPAGRKLTTAPDSTSLRDVLQRWRHMWPQPELPECCLCRLDQGDRAYPVDWDQTLAQLLRDTVVVEFPVFIIRAMQ